jgi:hypothetical protein
MLLVERVVDILHHLLQAIGAHLVVVALHSLNCFGDELPRIVLSGGFVLGLFHQTSERVVAVVLVAVLHEQIARRLANADPDDVLAVFLELDDEAREVGVAREQNERADLRPREDELECVDRQADVGRVLLRRPVRRREDQVTDASESGTMYCGSVANRRRRVAPRPSPE